ncbi:MAG: DoxX family protein [Chloroflexota bacterium]|nr:DoxX family protein [Chloroflexota bacterium]
MADRAFERRDLRDPRPIRLLFSNTGLAPLWLVARLYLGYEWLIAGWHKVWGPDRWIAVPGPDGLPLKAIWQRAVGAPADGQPPMAYDWYGDVARFMLRHDWYTWFSWIIAIGEVAAGVALIIGACTGLAALAGAFVNFNFLLAGSAGVNPLLFVIALLVMLGWKVSGWIGVDRWLLPALGTPWQPSQMWKRIGARSGIFGPRGERRTT